MRVAAIYDIHANLPALEAVLQDVGAADADLIVIGGDVVPGPMPNETMERVLDIEIPVRFISGNGEREVIAQMNGVETEWFRSAPDKWREPVRWTAQQLRCEHQQLVTTWPKTVAIEIPSLGEVLFCHATPRNDSEMFTRETPEAPLVAVFAGVPSPVVVCGHTHMQFDRWVGKTRVVNAGSVGMPFGDSGAYWLLLGHQVELRRTAYDLNKAAARIRETKYPQALDFAARNILQPLSEREALKAFAGVEIK